MLGLASDLRLTLATAFGEVGLELAAGDRIEDNDDQETVTLRTRHGDALHGAIVSTRILVRPYGAAEPRRVPGRAIRSLIVTDPIRIAGSERAAWAVEYENASGWTPTSREGCLEVTHIDADTIHTDSGGPWSTAKVIRRVDDRADFELEADISWDDRGAGSRTMQNLFVSVVDEYGSVIAAVGHHDA
jgi:hypothetical protein